MSLNILIVCHANVCRSPMAVGLLRHKCEFLKLDWTIESAGTSSEHEDRPAHRRAVSCMKRHHIDITDHRAQVFERDDFYKYNIIYVMDSVISNSVNSFSKKPEERRAVKLLMSEVYPDKDVDIYDPYGGSDSSFEMVYEMLDLATDKIIEKYSGKKTPE